MSRWQELTEDQLTALPTHRLYTVYKLMVVSRATMSYDHFERGNDNDYEKMEAKCKFVKSVLDTRGHIERDKTDKPWTKRSALRCAERMAFSWFRPKPEREIPQGSIKVPETAIGLQVYKTSKKPFKSKNVYNTVNGVTINPHTNLAAFTFDDDDSIVDAHICNIRKAKVEENE